MEYESRDRHKKRKSRRHFSRRDERLDDSESSYDSEDLSRFYERLRPYHDEEGIEVADEFYFLDEYNNLCADMNTVLETSICMRKESPTHNMKKHSSIVSDPVLIGNLWKEVQDAKHATVELIAFKRAILVAIFKYLHKRKGIHISLPKVDRMSDRSVLSLFDQVVRHAMDTYSDLGLGAAAVFVANVLKSDEMHAMSDEALESAVVFLAVAMESVQNWPSWIASKKKKLNHTQLHARHDVEDQDPVEKSRGRSSYTNQDEWSEGKDEAIRDVAREIQDKLRIRDSPPKPRQTPTNSRRKQEESKVNYVSRSRDLSPTRRGHKVREYPAIKDEDREPNPQDHRRASSRSNRYYDESDDRQDRYDVGRQRKRSSRTSRHPEEVEYLDVEEVQPSDSPKRKRTSLRSSKYRRSTNETETEREDVEGHQLSNAQRSKRSNQYSSTNRRSQDHSRSRHEDITSDSYQRELSRVKRMPSRSDRRRDGATGRTLSNDSEEYTDREPERSGGRRPTYSSRTRPSSRVQWDEQNVKSVTSGRGTRDSPVTPHKSTMKSHSFDSSASSRSGKRKTWRSRFPRKAATKATQPLGRKESSRSRRYKTDRDEVDSRDGRVVRYSPDGSRNQPVRPDRSRPRSYRHSSPIRRSDRHGWDDNSLLAR